MLNKVVDCILEIEKLFKEFSQKIHEINVYKKNTFNSKNNYLQKLYEQKSINDSDDFFSLTNFLYTDIIKQNSPSLGFNEQSIEELMQSIEYHHNKQYQWFLVESYELYEKFLEDLYVILGFYDNSFWSSQDFGNISINEISTKNKEWFKERVKYKKEKPYSIIKLLRKKLPNMKEYEEGRDIFINGIQAYREEKYKVNYKFYMAFISELRHCIVHDRGYIENKDKFLEKILKDIGLNNKKDEYLEHINPFFGIGKYENLICLNELMIEQNESCSRKQDRLYILLQDIVSYSKLISDLSVKYIQIKSEN